MTIRAVVFDYGGVLMDMRWDVAASLEREHNLPRGALVQTLYMSELWRQIEVGKADAQDHIEHAHVDLEVLAGRSLPRLHQQWQEAQHLIEDNIALVRTLRPAYRTAVLSNAGNTLADRLANHWGIADLFDTFVCSAEVGMAKPDPAIYLLAAEKVGLPAGECVFIDDSSRNVDAAREAGMHAVHYRVEQGHDLAAQLSELGVRTSA